MTNTEAEMKKIAAVLSGVRVPAEPGEYDIHAAIARALLAAGIDCAHEYPIAPRCRIDFLAGNIGIEVKKGRPTVGALKKQLARYLTSDRIDGLLVVMQKGVALPDRIAGKPVQILSLNRQWGVALP